MREYIMSIIGAGILCSFSEILSPDKWKKYIKLVTGVIITVIMISPIKKIDMHVFDIFNNQTEYAVDGSLLKNTVKEELESKVADDVRMRIKEKYGCESEVKAVAGTDEENNITGIELIEVKTNAEAAGAAAIITEVYGINKDRVKINGR